MNSSVHSRPLVKRRKQLWKMAVFCMAKGALHMICTSDHPVPGHRINISLRACVESWSCSTLVSGVVSCETKIRKRNHFRLSRLPRRELQRCLRDSRDIVLASPRIEKQGRRRSVALGFGIGDDLVLPLSVPQHRRCTGTRPSPKCTSLMEGIESGRSTRRTRRCGICRSRWSEQSGAERWAVNARESICCTALTHICSITTIDELTISLISQLPLPGCQFQSEVRQDRLEFFPAWLRSREWVIQIVRVPAARSRIDSKMRAVGDWGRLV
jgi:hypothetical protein